jgi:hypothetical protein
VGGTGTVRRVLEGRAYLKNVAEAEDMMIVKKKTAYTNLYSVAAVALQLPSPPPCCFCCHRFAAAALLPLPPR